MSGQAHRGTAERFSLDVELREAARRLLELESGDVATGPTSTEDLKVAVDYLQMLVQDGGRL